MSEFIENKSFDQERAFYNKHNILLKNVKIDGPADGESAIKESSNVTCKDCFFNLRYPFWHTKKFTIDSCEFTDKARAALWYCGEGLIIDSKLHGIKAVREANNIAIKNCSVISPEFGWKSGKLTITDSSIEGEYAFFGGKNLNISGLNFKGKYSFQYVNNCIISDSVLNTKDAFWHSKNVCVINSEVNGEYLAWYSTNLTLINCKITGTQPLCYCKGLKLIDCTMEGCDLAFEYSSCKATVMSDLVSIKNPKKGSITVYGNCDVIHDDPVYKCKGKVIFKK